MLKVVLVDNTPTLQACIAALWPDNTYPIEIAVDIEGVDLGRDGCISIIQFFLRGSDTVWLVDVTTLGTRAFDEADAQGRSLRQLLEGNDSKKYFYDVRNDSDALFSLYGITLGTVYDLQLLELASRGSRGESTKFLHGLKRCVEMELGNPLEWRRCKEEGVALFCPEHGGSYQVFQHRPLDPRLVKYCAQDVSLLFQLEAALLAKMGNQGGSWHHRIRAESADRVLDARSPTYQGKGRHKAWAPVMW